MPLSPPVPRQEMHVRRILCQGYRREDGLWDVEGRLIDTKTYDIASRDRGGKLVAGEPLHEMVVRVTVDDDFLIHRVEAVTEHAPFAICGEVAPDFAALAGLSLKAGFRGEVRNRFGGVQGCTHIIELLGTIATTAFQTIAPLKHLKVQGGPRPSIIDSCHALAADGPVVAQEWPEHATRKKA